jgi:hypothetical protein
MFLCLHVATLAQRLTDDLERCAQLSYRELLLPSTLSSQSDFNNPAPILLNAHARHLFIEMRQPSREILH